LLLVSLVFSFNSISNWNEIQLFVQAKKKREESEGMKVTGKYPDKFQVKQMA